ncbi:MAG TPA: PhzF family phenazine biosynthesis protein [Rhizomicrobium sp.]
MTLKTWQVDAFAGRPLEGNPAAVVPLQHWLDDALMQRIAGENSLSETAFFVKKQAGRYDLRWFTPAVEVDLCGHATLASAHVVLNFLEPSLDTVHFQTRSGELVVRRGAAGRNVMSLPADIPAPYQGLPDAAARIGKALGTPPPRELAKGRYLLVAVWDRPDVIRDMPGPGAIQPVLEALDAWGLIVTAPGDEDYDFISRFFAPAKGVPEDPVTGSAHCLLTPYWAQRLGKKTLKARQVSPRGGDLLCTDDGARTILEGACALYLTGEIEV